MQIPPWAPFRKSFLHLIWSTFATALILFLVVGCNNPPEQLVIPSPALTEESSSPQTNPTLTSISIPESTAIPQSPTATQKTTDAPTATNQSRQAVATTQFVPIKGGADKIAFINANEIWVSTLDGKDLKQLTEDGQDKSNLRWSMNGEAVEFISGHCLKSVDTGDLQINDQNCFQEASRLGSFEVSPDGNLLAISIDGQLYVLTFDQGALSQINSLADLSALSHCPDLAPYRHRNSRVTVLMARWSADGERLAILRQGTDSGLAVEFIQILDITECRSPLPRLDEFPATRFEMEDYRENATIQNFAWDGGSLFALTNNRRNDGFGDLWIYDSSLNLGFRANPIEGKCCYRDPVFSPDGEYLAFVFQDAQAAPHGPAAIYYLPFEALDTSMVFPPMNLPPKFFSEPRTKPQPALRQFPN